MTFGRETRIKFLGGELIYRQAGESFDRYKQRLEATKRRALNLIPVFERFKDVWFKQNEDVFRSEGLPAPWPALSPAYAEWKARRYPGKTMMRRSDRLFGSLVSESAETIWETTPRGIRFGSRVPYFMAHQQGSGNLPARPTLVLLPETFSELNGMVATFVTEDLRGR